MNTSSHGYFQNPVTATHSTLEEYASHQYNNFNGHHPSGGALPRSAPYPPRAPPTGSIVNMGNPEDTFEICVRHNRRRPRRQLVEITNAAGMTVLECLPGHMCRDKPPGTAQRRPREQDQGMGPRRTPEIAHSNATLNMGTTPVSDGSHLGGNWGQEVETKEATHVKVRQVLCVRHAKVRYLDECNEIEAGGVHVCSEHSDCLRSGPVDDMETVQRRLASLFEVQGPRDRGVKNQDDLNEASVRSPYGTTKALICSLHGYPRTLNYLKKDATSSGFCCFFPHQCRQRSLTSPKYHVLDSSLEFIRDA